MTPRPSPRLYLITPPVDDPAAFAPQLDAALAAGDIAAVLLRLAEADERTLINRTKIWPRPCSGAMSHCCSTTTPASWRAPAPMARICPASRLLPRRCRCSNPTASPAPAACTAVMMPCSPPRLAPITSCSATRRRAATVCRSTNCGAPAWWAELFEIPCVGYAASLDEVAPLAQTGADFIALGEWIWTEPHNAAATIAAAAQLLAAPAQ